MTKISLIAKLTAADGKVDELLASLDGLVAAAEEEPGLEVYSAHQDAKNPDVIYFFEVYTDQAALEVHGKGPAMKAAMATLGACLGGRPEITMLNPVGAKGLEL